MREDQEQDSQELATRPDRSHDPAMKWNIPSPGPDWEQKSVAVLALELTWPEIPDFDSPRYERWTELARWEQAILGKVQGFGGALVQRTASLFVWVFGLSPGLEQLPQRAIHSALAIRQMVADASAPDIVPCPVVRLAAHLGAVRCNSRAADSTVQVLAVGETLALPVRLLGQAGLGEIMVSPEVVRLVDGWVALEERPLQLRAGKATRVEEYAVVGVSPGRESWAGRRRLTRNAFVGREGELQLLEALLEQVRSGRGQVVSLVGPPGMGKSRLLTEFRQRLTEQHIPYVAGRCLAYGSTTPYLPVLDLLRDHCGIDANDPAEPVITKVRAGLQHASLDLELSLPPLLSLLGLP
jgi:hypothetical protein